MESEEVGKVRSRGERPESDMSFGLQVMEHPRKSGISYEGIYDLT